MTVGRRSSGRIAVSGTGGERGPLSSHLRASEEAQAKDDWKASCEALQKARDAAPDDVEVLVRLAEALRFSERLADALEVLDHAVGLAPDDFAVLFELASSARHHGEK